MPDSKVKLYEALILLNQPSVATDFEGCIEHVREIFRRAEAEVIVLRKWDERRLAFEIAGQKRGTYLLAYIKVAGNQIAMIERDSNLSEQVLRILVLRADHIGEVELELAAKDADLSLETKLRSTPKGESAPAAVPVAATADAASSSEDSQRVAVVEDAEPTQVADAAGASEPGP